ncbi:hypothetical protein C6341_g3568 [Phytophthora cactorum]|nr:hypothetical protein C6341_g3568 [Phytophthora cactorum]
MRIHHRPAKSPEFKSPFAPLHLAVEDEAQLEAVARMFVQNTVVQYEKFIEQGRRKVDSNHWKCIKHERDLRVFLQRRRKDVERRIRRHERLRSFRHRSSVTVTAEYSDADTYSPSIGSRESCCSSLSSIYSRRTGSFTSNHSNTNSSDSRSTTYSNDSDIAAGASTPTGVELPVLQLVGSVPGSLDDAMYGALGATADVMRVKSAYERDNITDGAVLATITTPTIVDPFRSLTVKWVEQEGPTIDHHRYHPLHYPVTLPGASTREDLIFLEATGTTQLASAAATTVTDTKLCVTCKKRGPWFSTHGKKKKPATTCQLCWRYVCSSCRLKKTVMNCVTDPRRDDRLSTHVVQREVTLCNVCVHQSMVATSARDVAREEIEADPKRWRFPSPTHTRERSSDGYLQAHLLSQLNASTHGTSALRPVSIVSLRSEHAVNDLFQRCA